MLAYKFLNLYLSLSLFCIKIIHLVYLILLLQQVHFPGAGLITSLSYLQLENYLSFDFLLWLPVWIPPGYIKGFVPFYNYN